MFLNHQFVIYCKRVNFLVISLICLTFRELSLIIKRFKNAFWKPSNFPNEFLLFLAIPLHNLVCSSNLFFLRFFGNFKRIHEQGFFTHWGNTLFLFNLYDVGFYFVLFPVKPKINISWFVFTLVLVRLLFWFELMSF